MILNLHEVRYVLLLSMLTCILLGKCIILINILGDKIISK